MPPQMITTDVLPSAQFKILSGTLKAFSGDDGRKRLSGVASSTTKDHHGDVMSESAILDMERSANDNLTIFLNHSYDVPEDVFGSVEKATAVQRGMDGDGAPNWDLMVDILVNDENDRASKTFDHIQKGTKLGLSIGANIPEGGAERDKETGALTINHVNLLETSVVSIPANPRSWIQNAVKALRKAEAPVADAIEVPVTATVTITEEVEVTEELEVSAPEVTEGCSSCGGGKGDPQGDCKSGYHKDDEPDVQAGTEPADDSSQEAPESEPEAGDTSKQADDPADSEEAMDMAVMAAVQGVGLTLEATTAKLAEMVDKLSTEKQLRRDAETQRDEAVAAATTVIAEVESIMERVGKTPAGRKTQFVSANKDFDHLRSVYSEPFLKLLKQGDPRE